MNISLVTSLFPEVNHLPRTTFSLCTTGFYAFKKMIERSSIYKVLELCPRDLFSHTKKRLIGVNKNIAFNKNIFVFM